MSASTLDGAQSYTLAPITLATAPGREWFRGMRLISERCYYSVDNSNIIDYYFRLSSIIHCLNQYTLIR